MDLYTDCFVCDIKTDEWRCALSGLVSQHSNTPVTVLIRTVLGVFQTTRNIDDELNCICADCLRRIEDCDWQRQAAQRCERELYELLVRTEAQCLAKQEPPDLEEIVVQPDDTWTTELVDTFKSSPRKKQSNIENSSKNFKSIKRKTEKNDGVGIKSESESSDSNDNDDPSLQCQNEPSSSESDSSDDDSKPKAAEIVTRTRSQQTNEKLGHSTVTKTEQKEDASSENDEQPRKERRYPCTQCSEVFYRHLLHKVRRF